MSINFTEAKKIPIEAFMASIGQKPKYNKNGKLLYHAPYRVDHNPSLLVWKSTNRWRDMSYGYGGDVVDLVVRLTSDGSYASAVKILQAHSYEELVYKRNEYPQSSVLIPHNRINSIIAVTRITNPLLVDYAKSRGISYAVLDKYCKEVLYQNSRGRFYAIGFPNDGGGYALRNSRYKGAISPVGITTIRYNNTQSRCMLFEGFFDFLSFIELTKDILMGGINADYIILNSLSNLHSALPVLSQYNIIESYLDTDKAGQEAFGSVSAYCMNVVNMAHIYSCFKDLNEYLSTSRYDYFNKIIPG